MKTKVEVLGFTSEGLTIVQMSNANYDAIVLYNEDTLEVGKEIDFNEYLSTHKVKANANGHQLGSVSKGIITDWFEALVEAL